MTSMINSGIDVTTFLREQHQQIRTAFAQVTTSHGEERQTSFYALRRLLAVHETAEEEVVHPTARDNIPDGELVVKARLQEENHAKHILSQLEGIDVDSSKFDALLATLQSNVLAHADAEERYEFEPLSEELDPSRLERMRRVVELAERVAPTRPHAGIESATANVLVGPFAAMLDRVRDAISGKG